MLVEIPQSSGSLRYPLRFASPTHQIFKEEYLWLDTICAVKILLPFLETMPLWSRWSSYEPISTDCEVSIDYDIDHLKSPGSVRERGNKKSFSVLYTLYQLSQTLSGLCISLLCFLLLATGASFFASRTTFGFPPSSCKSPTIRREWRGLHSHEKHDYINALQCLRQHPSKLGLNHSRYDDFPHFHIHYGENCMRPIIPANATTIADVGSSRDCWISGVASLVHTLIRRSTAHGVRLHGPFSVGHRCLRFQ